MKKILTLAALLVSAVSFSQDKCGIEQAENLRVNSDAHLLNMKQQWLDQVNEAQLNVTYPKAAYKVPVVFHIMHQFGTENISRAQIMDCLRVLNEDFNRANADTNLTRAIFKPYAANLDIEFVLANLDPDGNCTDGITRTYSPITFGANDDVKYDVNGGKSAWPTNRYMNIWVVGSINLDNSTSGGITLGYAYFPYSAGQSYYGLVMHNQYTGTIGTSNSDGRTISHEAGHAFGLAHTFNNGCGNNCNNSGDNVCDTPPTSNATWACNHTQNLCSNDANGSGAVFSTDVVDQVENFMSYDDCQNMFTLGQKNRAYASITSTGLNTMLSAANMTATGIDNTPIVCSPIVEFYAENPSICVGSSVKMIDYTLNSLPTFHQYTFESTDTVFSVLGANPIVPFTKAGLYKVTFIAGNLSGVDTVIKDNYITVFDNVSAAPANFIDDMDNQPIGSGRWGKNSKGELDFKGWEEYTGAGVSNNSCVYVNNFQATHSGFKSELISSNYSLTSVPNPGLTFKTAYARKNNSDSDILRVFMSTNCGQSWSIIYVRNNTTLPSSANTTSAFVPQANDWQTHKVILPSGVTAASQVRFKFEFWGRGGNNVYLDDINILAYSSEDEQKLESDIQLFPNPSSSFTLLSDRVMDEVHILSVDGKIVYSSKPQKEQWIYDASNNLADGVYYIQIKSGPLTQVKKWIKY